MAESSSSSGSEHEQMNENLNSMFNIEQEIESLGTMLAQINDIAANAINQRSYSHDENTSTSSSDSPSSSRMYLSSGYLENLSRENERMAEALSQGFNSMSDSDQGQDELYNDSNFCNICYNGGYEPAVNLDYSEQFGSTADNFQAQTQMHSTLHNTARLIEILKRENNARASMAHRERLERIKLDLSKILNKEINLIHNISFLTQLEQTYRMPSEGGMMSSPPQSPDPTNNEPSGHNVQNMHGHRGQSSSSSGQYHNGHPDQNVHMSNNIGYNVHSAQSGHEGLHGGQRGIYSYSPSHPHHSSYFFEPVETPRGQDSEYEEWDNFTQIDNLNTMFGRMNTTTESSDDELQTEIFVLGTTHDYSGIYWDMAGSRGERTSTTNIRAPTPPSSRRVPRRNVSSETLNFFQSIGIRIDGSGDELLNTYNGQTVMMDAPVAYNNNTQSS